MHCKVRYSGSIIPQRLRSIKETFCSNEPVTLYPIMPDPTNEGAVHMYTEERLLAEKINVISLSYLTLTPDC